MSLKLYSSESLLSRLSNSSAASELSPLQNQVDQLTSQFVAQSTSVQSLTALSLGGIAYQATRAALLSGIPLLNFASGRLLVSAISLGAEVSVFEGVSAQFVGSQGMTNHVPTNGPQKWLHSYTNFALMKLGGWAGSNQNILAQHLLQDS
ncbi:MAG: hypothetical protein JNK65_01310, partial [Deltaproteobacteria bacterium]|nr:hypothetical protein [Deltaproteobacteria bacterium]